MGSYSCPYHTFVSWWAKTYSNRASSYSCHQKIGSEALKFPTQVLIARASPLHPYFSISQHLSSTFVQILCSRQVTATTQILRLPPTPQARTTPWSLDPSLPHPLLEASTTCTPSGSSHHPCDLLPMASPPQALP